MFISENIAWIKVNIACDVLNITRSAYYAWLKKLSVTSVNNQKLAVLTVKIIDVFHKSKCRYGGRRISGVLSKAGIKVDYRKVSKILSKNGLRPIGTRKFRVTTNSKHNYPVFDNLLNQDFTVSAPNVAWVGDISYIHTDEGFVYLATVIDLYSRRVIGHKTDSRMTKELVMGALINALKLRNYPTGVIFHSDRGSQYASNEYRELLKKYKLIGSMSKKGCCYDNAVAESFFATIKKEYIYQTRFSTKTQAMLGVFNYIEAWYNNHRIHSKLGVLSPIEYELQYLDKLRFDKNIGRLNCAEKVQFSL
jgi:putative transposase